jgi:hypothetical protein
MDDGYFHGMHPGYDEILGSLGTMIQRLFFILLLLRYEHHIVTAEP